MGWLLFIPLSSGLLQVGHLPMKGAPGPMIGGRLATCVTQAAFQVAPADWHSLGRWCGRRVAVWLGGSMVVPQTVQGGGASGRRTRGSVSALLLLLMKLVDYRAVVFQAPPGGRRRCGFGSEGGPPFGHCIFVVAYWPDARPETGRRRRCCPNWPILVWSRRCLSLLVAGAAS